MSRDDETTSRDEGTRWEEELSAFLDGELDAGREAALRAALARDPALAARLEALRRVDAGLRAVPAPRVPGDLRARLQAQIEARGADADARGVGARPAAPRRTRAPRRRRLLAPGLAAAAVAAALALMLLVSRPAPDLPPERVADAPEPTPRDAEIAGPERVADAPEPTPRDAEIAGPEPTPRDAEVAELAPTAPAELPAEIAAASDEELEIAMEWEVLEDLEMLERLALLEAMLELERRGQG